MTDPMDTPRLATAKLHRKLKDRMYRYTEKHGITGFEAAGVLFALATEVMTSTLVRDGLLQGGPDWAEEEEQLEQDIPVPAEVKVDAASDAEAKLLAIIDCAHGRIAQLEHALRAMADLAQNEIKERQAQLTQAVITARNAKEQLTKEREVLRESLQLNGREARINELLHRFGLTLPTQEPQS
jgi:hypothetical protein